jgi:hypothetical protein
VKKRISTALATLLLLAISLPAFVIAQQSGAQPPAVPGARRPSTPADGPAAPGTSRTRRPRNPDATAGLEEDVAEALTVIQDNHVDGNKVKYDEVFKSSIIGMLRTLDPHSNFYDAKEFDFLAERCDRTLTLTAPLDLGRPRAGPKVHELNAAVSRRAGAAGALVVDLSDLRARNWVMPDRVHPTAFGQIAIAERALDVLARDGLVPAVRPSSLILYDTSAWRRLRGDATYVYRYVKNGLRVAMGR